MPMTADQSQAQTATRVDLGAIFIALELSKSTWLVTALSPGRETMSRHTVAGSDIAGLFACFAALRQKAKWRDRLYALVASQETGLDAFWLGRVPSKEAWIGSDRSFRHQRNRAGIATYSTRKACSDTSTIDAKSHLTQALPPRPGKAVTSIANRACQRPEIRV